MSYFQMKIQASYNQNENQYLSKILKIGFYGLIM